MSEVVTLTTEDVARGIQASVAPMSVTFREEDWKVTYLFPDDNNVRQLFSIDLKPVPLAEHHQYLDLTEALNTGEVSLEEQLRRERMRLFANGIITYEWSSLSDETYDVLMVPTNGQILIVQKSKVDGNSKVTVLYDGSLGPALDPHLSPDGKAVAYVINNDVYASAVSIDPSSSPAAPIRITYESKDGITCGVADFLAQEEMDRYRGFWWSPDSSMITYCVNNETAVPEYQILHQGKDDPQHFETHRYPFAGATNGSTKLVVKKVNLSTAEKGEPVNMNIVAAGQAEGRIDPDDYYLPRADWWPDGSVMAQVESRDQCTLQLLRLDPLSGRRVTMLEETSKVWVNVRDLLHMFSFKWRPAGAQKISEGDFYFLWGSERTGFMQLYLYKYDASSKVCECLNDGLCIGGEDGYVVDSIEAVDESNEVVYFTSSRKSPTEKHLYRCTFALGQAQEVEQITNAAGWHNVTVDVKTGLYLDVHSSLLKPAVTSLCRLPPLNKPIAHGDEECFGIIHDNLVGNKNLSRLLPCLQVPEIHRIRSTDNEVDLYCAVYVPDFDVHGPGPHPAVVSVYGGPCVQRVYDQWMLRVDLRTQKLVQDGYVVIKCDNRGSFRRGLAFEGAMRWDMGNVEVQDQVAAVRHFAVQGLVDIGRVGMFGWSYGGYMSAISLCRAPDVFSCAVAGAPVTSWDGYDTHYTERYMGTPESNPVGYSQSSVMTHVDKMKGKLLLVHGLIDENVHFRHTARLINELIRHRKRYDLILFPCERHSPHKLQDRIYLEDCMYDFLQASLTPKEHTAPLAQPDRAAGSAATPPVPSSQDNGRTAPSGPNAGYATVKLASKM
jgi:dipeptidyl-peptidase-4